MSDDKTIKEKAEFLKEKFLDALEIAEKIENSTKDIPDVTYYIALALLVGSHSENPMYQDALRLVAHIESEQKRLTSN